MGTLSYLGRGAIDWPLALAVGIPGELCGVLVGWRVTQAVPPRILKRAMIVALLVSAGLAGIHGQWSSQPGLSKLGVARLKGPLACRFA